MKIRAPFSIEEYRGDWYLWSWMGHHMESLGRFNFITRLFTWWD